MSVVATITVETQLLVVNKRTNSTRTSTIYNTDTSSHRVYQRPETNSAGTAIATVFKMDGDKTTFTTV